MEFSEEKLMTYQIMDRSSYSCGILSEDKISDKENKQQMSVSRTAGSKERRSEHSGETSEKDKLTGKQDCSTQNGCDVRNPEKSKKHQREATLMRKILIMAACVYLQLTAGGIATALGVIYVDLIRVFDAPHTQAALVQSLFIGTTVSGGVFFTKVLQRYGTGAPVMTASFTAGIAFLASAFAPSVPTLIVLIGIVAGLSLCVVFLSTYITISWMFQRNTKFFLAILSTGWTVGHMVFPYLSDFLVNQFRWNGSLIILSGVIFNCIPCGLLFYTSRIYFCINKSSNMTLRETVTTGMKDYVFILYLLAFFFFMGMAPVEMWFLVDVTIMKGFDRSVGTFLLSLVGITSLVGRITGAIFLRLFRIRALVHLSYSVLLWGVAHYLIGYFNELWGLVFAVTLRGIMTGVSGAVYPGSQIEIRDIERFPQTVAICNMMGGVAQALGGLLGGATVDMTGGYDLIFTLAALIFLVSTAMYMIVWFILRKREKKEMTFTATVYHTEKADEKRCL